MTVELWFLFSPISTIHPSKSWFIQTFGRIKKPTTRNAFASINFGNKTNPQLVIGTSLLDRLTGIELQERGVYVRGRIEGD